MSSSTEEIKSRLAVDQIISEYIKLTQIGQNWKGLCPFHNEKTPSLIVSPERNIWHCFGCGEGGDIFTFLMKIEGIEFPEALKILAQKAGVEIKSQNPQQINYKNKLFDINDLAKKFFIYQLKNSPKGEGIRDYLNKRKISNQSINDFELGYSLDSWDALLNFLKNKGYQKKDILATGLLVEKNNGQGYYDRFRNRLIFPINNIYGQTIGFTARSLDKKESAKYINSPQTQIYNKSEILYGLDKAKDEIRKRDYAILVEGQMDLISAHSVGSINTVAFSGTALTREQLNILRRYTKKLMFALDTDLAGSKATLKGSALAALEMSFNVKVVKIPGGKDPDECIKENKNNWFKALKNAQHYLDYYLDQSLAVYNSDEIDDKKEILEFMKLLKVIPIKIEQDYYIKKLAQKINVDEKLLREDLEKKESIIYNKDSKEAVYLASIIKKKGEEQMAEETLALFLKYPQIYNFFEGKINPEILINKNLIRIFRELISYNRNINENFKFVDFINQFKECNNDLFNLCQILIILAEKDFSSENEEIIKRQASDNVNLLEKNYILNRKKFLENQIKEAEETGKEEIIDDLMREVNSLSNRLVELDKEFDLF